MTKETTSTTCITCGKELSEGHFENGVEYCSEYCTHHLDVINAWGTWGSDKQCQ